MVRGFADVDGDVTLICPECGSEYSHIRNVVSAQQGDRDEYQVRLDVEGECDHSWYLDFHNHAGITTVGVDVRDRHAEIVEQAGVALMSAVPDAIATLADLANGSERVSRRAQQMLEKRRSIAEALGWRQVDGKWVLSDETHT